MTLNEIRSHSIKIKQQADKILKETGLIKTLSKFGKVTIIGSYALDLMYGPDIDLNVIADDPRTASLEIIKTLLEQRRFQKFQYEDFVNFKEKNRLETYRIALIKRFENIKWEIEIWFFQTSNELAKQEENFVDYVKANLTPEIRNTILKLKYERDIKKLTKCDASSVEIYKAVIEKRVKNIDEFLKTTSFHQN